MKAPATSIYRYTAFETGGSIEQLCLSNSKTCPGALLKPSLQKLAGLTTSCGREFHNLSLYRVQKCFPWFVLNLLPINFLGWPWFSSVTQHGEREKRFCVSTLFALCTKTAESLEGRETSFWAGDFWSAMILASLWAFYLRFVSGRGLFFLAYLTNILFGGILRYLLPYPSPLPVCALMRRLIVLSAVTDPSFKRGSTFDSFGSRQTCNPALVSLAYGGPLSLSSFWGLSAVFWCWNLTLGLYREARLSYQKLTQGIFITGVPEEGLC